jgi:hypothetical protein
MTMPANRAFFAVRLLGDGSPQFGGGVVLVSRGDGDDRHLVAQDIADAQVPPERLLAAAELLVRLGDPVAEVLDQSVRLWT